tara:strand:- start:3009 stop:3323 length:315 start_codon:yes stop_codon:yes gene_type:complete
MAITVIDKTSTEIPNKFEQTGLTDDFIFRADPRQAYKLSGVVTSAGSAAAISSDSKETPTDISGFAVDPSGLSAVNFSTVISAGSEWVGAQIDSGTWTIIITEL